MDYDPTQYLGSAAHYLPGRPAYARELGRVLAEALGWDGSGHLLDVGCGPGVLAVQLAPHFAQITALDPDPGMADEARRHAAANDVALDVLRATAEEIATLGLPMRAVTFGQSFHRVDRIPVAEAVHELLEPGGALVLVSHDASGSVKPPGTGDPEIPDDEVQELITGYLGPDRRSGKRRADAYDSERWEDSLARTSFGEPTTLRVPGRADITRDVDGVVSGYLSMSWAAPHLFGDRLDDFVADLRTLLAARTPTGRFWDWPGDTVALVVLKTEARWS